MRLTSHLDNCILLPARGNHAANDKLNDRMTDDPFHLIGIMTCKLI